MYKEKVILLLLSSGWVALSVWMSVYDGLYIFSIVLVFVMTVVTCFTCVCCSCSVCVPWSVCWIHAKRKVCLNRSSEQETTTSSVNVELVRKDMA